MRKSLFILASIALCGVAADLCWSQQSTSGANQGAAGANQPSVQSGANAPGAALNQANTGNSNAPGANLNQSNPAQTNAPGTQLNQSNAGGTNGPGPGATLNQNNPNNTNPGAGNTNQQDQRRALDQPTIDSSRDNGLNLSNELQNSASERERMLRQERSGSNNLRSDSNLRNDSAQPNGVQNPRLLNESATQRGPRQRLDRELAINRLRQSGRSGQNVDDWRVVEHNGRMWYWTPERSWMYFNNGAWSPLSQNRRNQARGLVGGNPAFPDGYPADDWRMVNQNGRNWYWTPDETWMYMDGNRWSTYRDRATAQGQNRNRPRYNTGYRGADGNNLDTGTDRRYIAEPFDAQRRNDQIPQQRTFREENPQNDTLRTMNADQASSPGNSQAQPGSGRTPPPQPEEPSIEGGKGPSDVQDNQTSPVDGASPSGESQTLSESGT